MAFKYSLRIIKSKLADRFTRTFNSILEKEQDKDKEASQSRLQKSHSGLSRAATLVSIPSSANIDSSPLLKPSSIHQTPLNLNLALQSSNLNSKAQNSLNSLTASFKPHQIQKMREDIRPACLFSLNSLLKNQDEKEIKIWIQESREKEERKRQIRQKRQNKEKKERDKEKRPIFGSFERDEEIGEIEASEDELSLSEFEESFFMKGCRVGALGVEGLPEEEVRNIVKSKIRLCLGMFDK